MRKLLVLLFIFGISLLSGCQSRESEPAKGDIFTAAQGIDSLFKSHFERDLFHGGVVITHHGETIYEHYFGVADRSWGIPFDEEVKLDIASVNKSMIAGLAMKAVEEGRLALDDKLMDLLSGFSYRGHFHPDISLHHLLSHTAGLADYDGVGDEWRQHNYRKLKRSRFSDTAYVDFISQLPTVGEPGKQFHYSNFAYHLVAIILADTYSRPFAEVLREKLTAPLGLNNTMSAGLNERVIPRLAEAYTYQASTQEWLANPFIDLSLSRRIFSTAADLNRWARVMDNPGWLTENSLKLLQQNHLDGISEKYTYGYGWVIFDKASQSAMGKLDIEKPYIIHGGRTDGYKSMLINIYHGEYVISFLSNVGKRTNEMQLAQSIVEILIK